MRDPYKNSKLYLFLAAVVIFLCSCKKEENSVFDGVWQTNIAIDFRGQTTTYLYSLIFEESSFEIIISTTGTDSVAIGLVVGGNYSNVSYYGEVPVYSNVLIARGDIKTYARKLFLSIEEVGLLDYNYSYQWFEDGDSYYDASLHWLGEKEQTMYSYEVNSNVLTLHNEERELQLLKAN